MPTQQTTPSPTPPAITKVWVVEKDSYAYNDEYVTSAVLPGVFYLDETKAKISAGYQNMQVLFDGWYWFWPPKDSVLSGALSNNGWDFGDEAPTGNYAVKRPSALLDKVYGMSMDEACLFFSDQNNINALLDEVGKELGAETALYVVCELTLADD
jgi:hypothetical protein